MSTAESAEILDVSEDVIKTRLHRARLLLRAELDVYFKDRHLHERHEEGVRI